MNRLHQIINELKEEHGMLPARRMAKKKRIAELLEELQFKPLTTDERLKTITLILSMMNMDD